MLCALIIYVSVKADSEQQIFEKRNCHNYIYPQIRCQKSAEKKSSKIYFFIFRLVGDAWPEPHLYKANTLHLSDYSDVVCSSDLV